VNIKASRCAGWQTTPVSQIEIHISSLPTSINGEQSCLYRKPKINQGIKLKGEVVMISYRWKWVCSLFYCLCVRICI